MAQCRTECTVCLEVFNSVRSFDKHRTGTYHPNNRRCLTIPEMIEKGFSKNPKGWWGFNLSNSSEEVGFDEEVSLPDEDEQDGILRIPNQLDLALEKGGSRTLGDEASLSQEEENREATQVIVG